MNQINMKSQSFSKRIFCCWKEDVSKLVLLLLIIIFFIYSIFLVFSLNDGYIPDEGYRFEVSQDFSTTWGIPAEAPITQSTGEEQHRNPFMGYWIFGRALNLISLVMPDASDQQFLVGLRFDQCFVRFRCGNFHLSDFQRDYKE